MFVRIPDNYFGLFSCAYFGTVIVHHSWDYLTKCIYKKLLSLSLVDISTRYYLIQRVTIFAFSLVGISTRNYLRVFIGWYINALLFNSTRNYLRVFIG